MAVPPPRQQPGVVNFYGVFLSAASRDALFREYPPLDSGKHTDALADKLVLAVHTPEVHLKSLRACMGRSVRLVVTSFAQGPDATVVGVEVSPDMFLDAGDLDDDGASYGSGGDSVGQPGGPATAHDATETQGEGEGEDEDEGEEFVDPAQLVDDLLADQPQPHIVVAQSATAPPEAATTAFLSSVVPVPESDGRLVIQGRIGASVRGATDKSSRACFDAEEVAQFEGLRYTDDDDNPTDLTEALGGPWVGVEDASLLDRANGSTAVAKAEKTAESKRIELRESFGIISGGVTQAVHNFRVRALQAPARFTHAPVVPGSSMPKVLPASELAPSGEVPGDGLRGPLRRLNAQLVLRVDNDGAHALTGVMDGKRLPSAAAGAWDMQPLLQAKYQREAGDGHGKTTAVARSDAGPDAGAGAGAGSGAGAGAGAGAGTGAGAAATPGTVSKKSTWKVFERYNSPLEATPWLGESGAKDVLLGAPREGTLADVWDSVVTGDVLAGALSAPEPGREILGWQAIGGLKTLLQLQPVRNTPAFCPVPRRRQVSPWEGPQRRYVDHPYEELEVFVQVRRGFHITLDGLEVKPYFRARIEGTGVPRPDAGLGDGDGGGGFVGRLKETMPATSNPEFNTEGTLEALVPGNCELVVDVLTDAGMGFGDPVVLGSTRIDLEHRWRDPTWYELQQRNFVPIEVRSLLGEDGVPNGSLELYVVMSRKGMPYARRQLPAPEGDGARFWELRVVLWSVFGFASVAPFYIKGFLVYDGDDPPTSVTELNEGVRVGKTSECQVNWRFKFPVRVVQDAPPVSPRLVIQVIKDTWVFSKDPPVAETVLDMSHIVSRARETHLPQDLPAALFSLSGRGPGGQGGRMRVQVSLVPPGSSAVGDGRKPPNENPFIPEPAGLSGVGRFVRSVVRFFKRFGLILVVLVAVISAYILYTER